MHASKLRWFAEHFDGAFFVADAGLIAVSFFDDGAGLAVELAEGDLGGADGFAHSTVDAAVGHVDGADEVEDGDVGGLGIDADIVEVVEGAVVAETHRADVSAAHALGAAGEGVHPEGETLLRIFRDGFRWGRWLGRFRCRG